MNMYVYIYIYIYMHKICPKPERIEKYTHNHLVHMSQLFIVVLKSRIMNL